MTLLSIIDHVYSAMVNVADGGCWSLTCDHPRGGGGGTPLSGLYGDVPLDRVWFFGLAVLNRVCNLTCLCPKQVRTCPKQGMVLLFFFLACHPGPERS